MNQHDQGDELPLDPAAVAADDLLLDLLGRGGRPDADPARAGEAAGDDAGDPLAALLAVWRADLDTDASAVSAGPVPDGREIAGDDGPDPAEVAEPDELAGRRRARAARTPRLRRAVLRVAAVVALLAGLAAGAAVGSRHAGPDSALWSLTKVLYPEQAEIREVERTLGQARTAVAERRFDDAQRLVDRARAAADDVGDPRTAARLRAEADEVARQLATARAGSAGSAGTAPPGGTTAPGGTGPTPTGTPAPTAPGTATAPPGGATPGPTATGGGLLPLPLPTSSPLLPLPLPSLPLPGLPLPSGLLPG